MSQWQVRATRDNGAVLTFGLSAPDKDLAMLTALERTPWSPRFITVVQVPLPPGQSGVTYTEHQKHTDKHAGCRFCP